MYRVKYLKEELFGLADDAERKNLIKEIPIQKACGAWVKEFSSEDEQADGSTIATFRVTDSGIDREGDIILSAGMDTDQYERAGSLLWGHRADLPELVLGAPIAIDKQDTSIDIQYRFASVQENPTGAMVGRMVKAGIVLGTSVGILIREYTEASDRGGFMPLNILASELLEVSVTPIPANPRAVRIEREAVDYVIDNELSERRDTVSSLVRAWQDAAKAHGHKPVAATDTDPVVAAFVRAVGKKG